MDKKTKKRFRKQPGFLLGSKDEIQIEIKLQTKREKEWGMLMEDKQASARKRSLTIACRLPATAWLTDLRKPSQQKAHWTLQITSCWK